MRNEVFFGAFWDKVNRTCQCPQSVLRTVNAILRWSAAPALPVVDGFVMYAMLDVPGRRTDAQVQEWYGSGELEQPILARRLCFALLVRVAPASDGW